MREGDRVRVHLTNNLPESTNAAVQVGQGLLGAFIVEPRQSVAAHRADVDYVMVLNDGSHGYTLESDHGMFGMVTALIVQKPGVA